jgi:hypothetical protein
MQVFLDGKRYESPAIRAKILAPIADPDVPSDDYSDKLYIVNNREKIITPGQKHHLLIRFCHSDLVEEPVVFEHEAVGIPSKGGGSTYLMSQFPTLVINEYNGPLWYLRSHIDSYRYECDYLGGRLWVQEIPESIVRMGIDDSFVDPARFFIGYNNIPFGGDIEIQHIRDVFLMTRQRVISHFLELGRMAAEERDRMEFPDLGTVPPRYTLIG